MHTHFLFGNETAEKDDLLYRCRVDRQDLTALKSILTGRWGVGKTALLLIQNSDLASKLAERSPDLRDIWYIHERSIDVDALIDLKSRANDRDTLLAMLEKLWRSEIVPFARL